MRRSSIYEKESAENFFSTHLTSEVPASSYQQIALPDHLFEDGMVKSRRGYYYDFDKSLRGGSKGIGGRYRSQ